MPQVRVPSRARPLRSLQKTDLPAPDRCTICLGQHPRADCPLLRAQDAVLSGRRDLITLQAAVDTTRRAMINVDFFSCGYDSPDIEPDDDYRARLEEVTMLDFEAKQRFMAATMALAGVEAVVVGKEAERRRLQIALCAGRCGRYKHEAGCCATVPVGDFERVHQGEMEREAAKAGRWTKRKVAVKAAAAMWRPRKRRLREAIYLSGSRLVPERDFLDLIEQARSPCEGRERNVREKTEEE